MDREDLVNMVEEELKVASELGYEFRHTAHNVVAIVEGEKGHLDYNPETQTYEWDDT